MDVSFLRANESPKVKKKRMIRLEPRLGARPQSLFVSCGLVTAFLCYYSINGLPYTVFRFFFFFFFLLVQ